MGASFYDIGERSLRSESVGYSSKSVDEVFTQQRLKIAHESMIPKGIKKRECRDSAEHPATIPIILNLDVTGSMLSIPADLIKEGLPKMMGGLIQNGAADASLLFTAIGDHECDRFPLQVGQFESGDAELDLWLTRSYLEGGGGCNAGESYLLAHYFAAFHTETDAYSKRGKRGFLFTVGDEPGLRTLPGRVIDEIMGTTGSKTYSDKELVSEAQKMYECYHLVLTHSSRATSSIGYWKDLLGQNCIEVKTASDVPKIITDIVVKNTLYSVADPNKEMEMGSVIDTETPMML